ncbi:translation machinery-associated protein 16 homolog [Sitodiplosis mosellana]|uniref:translation machinery-associated protein 16 homolog n=1 Tax=Sitodiplosis mosellana TaxID=263140 RepID=UPI002443FDCC|nr:translation machinery-associated protein 16 homolog [Sitodiplosis mosellana]
MPPTSILKDISKLKHPNSRKTKQAAKKAKRFNNRTKIKIGHAIKSNVMGERFAWFTDKLEQFGEQPCLTPSQFTQVIEQYLNRFSDELETINLKQSISKNRTNQHASRLAVIKMSMEREKGEFEGAGIELIDLCDPQKYKQFISWDGDSINLQHFKLDRIGRKYLQKLDESTKMDE